MFYLDELNDPQREAAKHKDGPLLVIAGAGAGKTRTVACRVLHLIKSGGAEPNFGHHLYQQSGQGDEGTYFEFVGQRQQG